MYLTAKELHIALDLGLQFINSNRERSIQPEEKDMFLNKAMYQFIDTRISPKLNTKKEGFEATIKRYDDLQELKKTITYPTYIDSSEVNRVFCPLPHDYYHLINSRSKLLYNCNYVSKSVESNGIFQVIALPLVTNGTDYNSFSITVSYYDNNVLTVSKIVDLGNYTLSTIDDENVFEMINIVLSDFNNLDGRLELFYKDGAFYLICREPTTSFSLVSAYIYSEPEIDVTVITDLKRYNLTPTMTSPNDLFKSEEIEDMIGEYYYSKNRQLAPCTTINEGNLYVYENNKFAVKNVTFTYIRKPKLINISTNQGCELNKADEIVDIAIQTIKGVLGSPTYQHIVNENLKRE